MVHSIDVVATDPTFWVTPRLAGAMHVMILAVFAFGAVLPIGVAIMRSKSTEAYEAVFHKFKDLGLDARTVITYWGRKGWRNAYPKCKIYRCMWHFVRCISSRWPPAQNIWERVHIDFPGYLDGYNLLSGVDAFSKWPFFKTLGYPSLLSMTMVRNLSPRNSSNFLSGMASSMSCPPWHPSSNGLAERTVRSVKDLLPRFHEGDIHARVARVLHAMRIALRLQEAFFRRKSCSAAVYSDLH
ncbi:hypothetical protein FOCC_FOCC016474 [Frankliniella occidentalis]|nr:hypothetical protein FOCC_FOCC016474 [Frankliniella occidentalis]